ncbi:MAG: PCRF domain-containing protein, partial [Candidatus Moraniibacteriota bacterium]
MTSLQSKSEAVNFWDRPEEAARIMQELDGLKKEKIDFYELGKRLASADDFLALSELGENEMHELSVELQALEKILVEWEFQLLLGGEYDGSNALLTIRSGAGGTEAQDWAEMLLRMYLRYAERRGWRTNVLDESKGTEAGIKSVTIEIRGRSVYGYLRGEAGVHRLVRLSPFNADNLRQTSFASVEVMPEIGETESAALRSEDLRVDTYRASGAGGQHV